jgi:hypothetical protein
MEYSSEDVRIIIIRELCNPKTIIELMMDSYGNFTLQKVIKLSKNPYYSFFIEVSL